MELPDRLRGRARPKAGLEQVGKAFLTPAVLARAGTLRASVATPVSRLACASSTLTASARDTKRGLAGVAHHDSYLQSLGGEICLILPPSERTCWRLSQDVASRATLRNRNVINTKSAR
jgi:hypothetical protein